MTLAAHRPRDRTTDHKRPAESVYVHVPFCVSRCPYCDFYKTVEREPAIDAYLDALAAEARARASSQAAVPLRPRTVFIGGGTPSFLDDDRLARLLAIVTDTLDLAALEEWTVECNPNSLTAAKAARLKAAGVTRLSIGAQSFDADNLSFLGRAHVPADIAIAVDHARAAGFETFNLDLITGLPTHWRTRSRADDIPVGQEEPAGSRQAEVPAPRREHPETLPDLAGLDRDIDALLALEPPHVSVYSLTIEPDTPFGERAAQGERLTACEETQAALYEHVNARLRDAGIERYEVSNHARPGHECRHNHATWRCEPYVGLGPGAHSDDGETRTANKRDLAGYVRAWTGGGSACSLPSSIASVAHPSPDGGQDARPPAEPVAFAERVTPVGRATEMLLVGLRTRNGVDLADVRARTGIDAASRLATPLAFLTGRGWVAYTPAARSGRADTSAVCAASGADRLRVTDAGLLLLDRVVLELASALDE